MTMVYDLKTSRWLRDEGIARVLGNNKVFCKRFYEYVEGLPRGWVGNDDDVRKVWPWPQPTHHNAWGGVWNGAILKGLVVKLPAEVHMKFRQAHARKTHLYERVWNW